MSVEVRDATVQSVESTKSKRGFTLTEIAIVLGIIGLILGAIWVAASAVYNNMRVSNAQKAVLTVTQNIRSMYATANAVDNGANMALGPAANAAGQLTYINAGIFPTDLLNNATPALSTVVYTPFGRTTYMEVEAATQVNLNDSFEVVLSNIPSNGCIQLVMNTAGSGRDPGLYAWGATTTSTLVPAATQTFTQAANTVLAANLQAACGTLNTSSVGFFFTLK